MIIRKLSLVQKQTHKGGSFYAVALGIGILVATVSSLIMNIVGAATGNKQISYGYRRSAAMLRLSPVPSRSSIMIF